MSIMDRYPDARDKADEQDTGRRPESENIERPNPVVQPEMINNPDMDDREELEAMGIDSRYAPMPMMYMDRGYEENSPRRPQPSKRRTRRPSDDEEVSDNDFIRPDSFPPLNFESCDCARDDDRESDRDHDRDSDSDWGRENDRDRDWDRGRDRDNDRENDRDVDSDRGRGRECGCDRDRDLDSDRGQGRDCGCDRDRDVDSDRGRGRDCGCNRDRDLDSDRGRGRDCDCDRDSDVDSDRDRDRDWGRDRGRDRDDVGGEAFGRNPCAPCRSCRESEDRGIDPIGRDTCRSCGGRNDDLGDVASDNLRDRCSCSTAGLGGVAGTSCARDSLNHCGSNNLIENPLLRGARNGDPEGFMSEGPFTFGRLRGTAANVACLNQPGGCSRFCYLPLIEVGRHKRICFGFTIRCIEADHINLVARFVDRRGCTVKICACDITREVCPNFRQIVKCFDVPCDADRVQLCIEFEGEINGCEFYYPVAFFVC